MAIAQDIYTTIGPESGAADIGIAVFGRPDVALRNTVDENSPTGAWSPWQPTRPGRRPRAAI